MRSTYRSRSHSSSVFHTDLNSSTHSRMSSWSAWEFWISFLINMTAQKRLSGRYYRFVSKCIVYDTGIIGFVCEQFLQFSCNLSRGTYAWLWIIIMFVRYCEWKRRDTMWQLWERHQDQQWGEVEIKHKDGQISWTYALKQVHLSLFPWNPSQTKFPTPSIHHKIYEEWLFPDISLKFCLTGVWSRL